MHGLPRLDVQSEEASSAELKTDDKRISTDLVSPMN